jgi:uncharacterized protein (DUF1800 family)
VEEQVDDRHRVARLFARAAFGATAADIDTWTANGYVAAVDHLLSFAPASGRADDVEVDGIAAAGLLADQPGYYSYPVDITQFQGWWLKRMASTKYPLEEKLTLYWHGHFATAYGKVLQYAPMLRQNKTIRDRAGGSFRDLAKAVTTDAATLIYLDGGLSTPDRPNENYAREFFELFSLGHNNGYTQADIHEAARAYTGLALNDAGIGQFYPTLHDAGLKTILGNTGAWLPFDVIDLALDHHPQGHVAAAYIAWRVADFFHHPNPEPEVVQAMASALVAANYQVKPMLRTLFLHPDFTDGAAVTQRSPAEIVATTMRAFNLGFTEATATTAAAYTQQFITYGQSFDMYGAAAQQMGQSLFNPVNVAGWKGGKAWSNTATVIARYNWAAQTAQLVTGDTVEQVLSAAGHDPAQTAPAWMAHVGLLDLRADTQAAVAQWVSSARSAGDTAEDVARGVLLLVLASPDFAVR